MNKIDYDMAAQDYRAVEALNKSSIDKILRCPLEYRLEGTVPDEPTPAMAFGTLVHGLLLEPDKLYETFHTMSQPATTKAGKAEKAQALAEGKTLVSQADFDKAMLMRSNALSHPAAGWLLDLRSASEVSLFWDLPTEDGRIRRCKGRIDLLAFLPEDKGEILVDLKTHSGSVAPEEIERTMYRFGYHRQAGWYMDGYERVTGHRPAGFYFIFLSTTAPYLVTACKISDQAADIGYGECLKAERILHECEESGKWPSYSDKLIEVDLPAWVYRKVADEMDVTDAVPF